MNNQEFSDKPENEDIQEVNGSSQHNLEFNPFRNSGGGQPERRDSPWTAKPWAYPLLVILLVAGMAGNGVLYASLSSALNKDNAQIASLQSSVSNLQNSLTSLQGDVQILNDSVSTLLQPGGVPPAPAAGSAVDFSHAAEVMEPSVVVIQDEVQSSILGIITYTEQQAGTGWIIDSDGVIVTNNHVVQGANSVSVTLADGRNYPAVYVQGDAATDLAVIKINAQNLPVAPIGDSTALKVGQQVAAVGNALNLGISLVGGWVSRLDTSITFSDGTTLTDMIETDAAINPGNSGGPLVNASGQVVGIANSKLVETGVSGIGYAISISTALPTINHLISQLP